MKLIDYLNSKHGTQTSLASDIGVTQGLVSQWLKGTKQISKERCFAIESATNGLVTCEEIRPDINWHYIRSQPPIK